MQAGVEDDTGRTGVDDHVELLVMQGVLEETGRTGVELLVHTVLLEVGQTALPHCG